MYKKFRKRKKIINFIQENVSKLLVPVHKYFVSVPEKLDFVAYPKNKVIKNPIPKNRIILFIFLKIPFLNSFYVSIFKNPVLVSINIVLNNPESKYPEPKNRVP